LCLLAAAAATVSFGVVRAWTLIRYHDLTGPLASDTATPLAAIGAEPLAPLGDLFIGNLAEQDVGNLEVDPRADRA